MAIGPIGSVFVSGVTFGDLAARNRSRTRSDLFLSEFAADGTQLWTKQLGSRRGEEPWGLAIDPFGDVYIAASTHELLGGAHFGEGDIAVLKLGQFGTNRCYADCDGSGTLTIFDFLCFQNAFVNFDLRADCTCDTQLDVMDFLCYQDEFVAGCM